MSIHASQVPPTEITPTEIIIDETVYLPGLKPATVEFETSDIDFEWIVIKEDIQMDENKVEEILRHYTPE